MITRVLFKDKLLSKLSQPKGMKLLLKHQLKYILGVVLSIDMGMRVHINSSLHVNHVAIISINELYFLDDHVS